MRCLGCERDVSVLFNRVCRACYPVFDRFWVETKEGLTARRRPLAWSPTVPHPLIEMDRLAKEGR